MTKNTFKLGCLSSSLTKFLNLTEEKRKEKYGKSTAKYYQRVINSLKASFDDHLFAYHNLPNAYAEKIDFKMFYKGMISTALTKKWINDMPDDIIEDLIQNLGLAHQGIRDTPIGSIAEKDFENVTSWLSYLKNLKRLKKDQPKIYDSYFSSF